MLSRWGLLCFVLLLASPVLAGPKIIVHLFDVRFADNGTKVTANMSLDFPGAAQDNRGEALPETSRNAAIFDTPAGVATAVKNYIINRAATLDPPVTLVADEIWVFGAPQ